MKRHNYKSIWKERDDISSEKMLFEIVYNLIDNVIKYNNVSGSIDISVETSRTDALLVVKIQELVFLWNTWTEFLKDLQGRIKVIKASGDTGLRLSIVKRAVLCHNGKINIKSEVSACTGID